MGNISEIQNALRGTLNSTVLSGDSLYGIFIIVVIGLLIYHGIKTVTNSIGSILAFLFLLEIGHIVAYDTNLGSYVPLMRDLFKYDVLTAFAQLCVGTKLSDFLLHIQAYITAVVEAIEYRLGWLIRSVVSYLPSV